MRVLTSHLVSSASADIGQVPLVIPVGTLSGSFTSPPLDVLHLYGWSASAISHDILGELSIQVSNCGAPPIGLGDSPRLDGWVTYPNVSVQLSGSSDSAVWNMQGMFVRWIRFVWSHSSGTGSIDLNVTGKGSAT